MDYRFSSPSEAAVCLYQRKKQLATLDLLDRIRLVLGAVLGPIRPEFAIPRLTLYCSMLVILFVVDFLIERKSKGGR